MNLVAGAILGCAAALALWVGLRPVFERSVFERQNYRDVTLPTGVGVVVPIAALVSLSGLTVLTTLGWRPDRPGLAALGLTTTATIGFSLLGLLDDVALDRDASGYRGHVLALAKGRLTAGSLKMLAGPMVAVVVVAPVAGDSTVRLLADGALVALAANLANLFDRAPGRVAKVAIVAGAVLVACAGAAPELLGVTVVLGATVALLIPDLREQMMLGDAGANPIGAALGLGVVLTTAPATRTWVLVAVLALNLVSERISFSSVIKRVAPLRVLDRLGRSSSA